MKNGLILYSAMLVLFLLFFWLGYGMVASYILTGLVTFVVFCTAYLLWKP